jgi:ubiquinol-cytochrome c reductase cytochrome b subunit
MYFWVRAVPARQSMVSINSQPDWYLQMIEGAMRLWPGWRIDLGNYTVPAVFWPAVVMPIVLFGSILVYPFVERRLTRDSGQAHNIAQRPRDVPVRTGFGAMTLAFSLVLVIGGNDDVIDFVFSVPFERVVWFGRIGILVLPPLAFSLTYRICLGLQRADRDVIRHGVGTGVIERHPEGYFVEVTQPLRAEPAQESLKFARYRGNPVPHLPGDLDTTKDDGKVAVREMGKVPARRPGEG